MANPLKDAVIGTVAKVKKAVKKVLDISSDTLYNYDDKQNREETVAYLTLYADGQRQPQVSTWQMCNNYYNNQHDSQNELYDYCKKKNIPWIPAIIPDPYIHVESQINPDIPDFEFSGRDDDMDSTKAKQRQYVTQYVLDNNEMIMKNNRNERRLGKLGNEVYKIGYDYNIELPGNVHGNIFIHDIDPANFVNDPLSVDMDDGEYHIYPYQLHRIKAARIFSKELEKLGMSIEDIGNGKPVNTQIYSTETYDLSFDSVQIIEFWFRQPKAGSEKYTYTIDDKEITKTVEWEAGDIACTIQINNTEIKYIPKYWLKTSKQNKMFPFAIGYKIPVENRFWGKSELETIKELVDTSDRELAINILNDTFTANDIIIMDDNTLTDGSVPINEPAAIWYKRPGTQMPQRLGGLSGLNNGLKDTITYIREIIKETIGNFDINMGNAPPANVRTLGALVQLKEQGNSRQNRKKAGTTAMWERILKLIDYTAIEFFDDNRLIYLGATVERDNQPQQTPWQEKPWNMGQQGQQQGQLPQQGQTQQNMDRSKGPVVFKYNSDNMRVYDDQTNEYFYPVVDYKVIVGDGITNSPAMTIEATEKLATMSVTLENKEIVKGLCDLMKLPNRKQIKDSIDTFFNNQMSMPFLFKDMPAIRIQLDQMPMDIQAQIFQQMGMQTNGGLNPELQIESQKNQTDAQLKQQELQQNQIDHTAGANHIISKLSPEELAHLRNNPHLIDAAMKQVQGGQA